MSGWRARAERYFEFRELGTGWRTEILAGATTFLTMAYIVFVNPSILAEAGMPRAAVTAATCLSAAFASILMGLAARYPIALAPGMGLNAYFTYAVVIGMGVPWQTALGAVFLSGVAFLALTLTGLRELIVAAIPRELHAAVAVGIGLFIALIGLLNAGIIVRNEATTVTLGNLAEPATLVSIFGLLATAALMAWNVKAAMLTGILAATALAVLTGVAVWEPQPYSWSEITATAFALDVPGALSLGVLEIVFVFLFVDLFDNVGTLLAVGKKAGLIRPDGRILRVKRIFLTDSVATTVGALAGTSTVVSYIESAAGVGVGGRSGVTATVTGLLFVAALFLAPLVGVIPLAATAPALILVGCLMAGTVAEIDWRDPAIAIPAFLTVLLIPLSFSIANGLALGFTSYTLIRIARGQFRSVHWFLYVLTALFLARFVYLGGAA